MSAFNKINSAVFKVKNIYFGWWITFYGFMLMGVSFSIIMNCHNLFIIPVTKSLGMTRADFTLTFTIMGISAVIMSPLISKVINGKYSMKKLLTVFILIAGLTFAGFSLASAPWHFYLLAILISPGFVGCSNLTGSLLVNNWFIDHKGLALGIVAAGSGIGTALLSPIISDVILLWGWKVGYIFCGLLILVICLPLTWVFAVRHPQDKSLMPLRKKTHENKLQDTGVNYAYTGFTFEQIKRMPFFWVYMLSFFVICVSIGGVVLNFVAYMQGVGHSPNYAVMLYSIQAIGMLGGKLFLGIIFDKMGAGWGIILAFIISAIAIMGFFFSYNPTIALITAILLGISASFTTVGAAYLTGSIFGNKDFDRIYGLTNITLLTGGPTGQFIMNMVFDQTGSYILPMIMFLILLIVCFLILLIIQKMQKRDCTVVV